MQRKLLIKMYIVMDRYIFICLQLSIDRGLHTSYYSKGSPFVHLNFLFFKNLLEKNTH